MKNIFKSINILVVVLLLASCSESFLDVNTDPNNPLTVSPDLVLPVALNFSNILEERDRGMNHLGNLFMPNWAQSNGFSWYDDEFNYRVTSSFYTRLFDYQYSSVLKQYKVLISLEGKKFGYYQAIGKIMSSLHYQILVDTYGDVPYTEALQRGGNATPKYDDALSVYEGIMQDLTDAIALINATRDASVVIPVLPGSDDGIFGGDMDMWKTFANTIKLRILVRQSDIAGRREYIQAQFNTIRNSGDGFMNEDVTINIGYDQITDQQNRKWNDFGADVAGSNVNTGDATCATPYVLDRLTATKDGRLNFLFEEPATGHLGVPQGLLDYGGTEFFTPALVSNIGPGLLKSPQQSGVVYTAAESYFNRAEAALKGYILASPKSMYEAGIQASFDYLGAGDASGYYSQNAPTVGWAASPNKLEAIITQKWIGLMGINALQTWFDYSRTGYPSNMPLSLLATTPDRPVRLFYPASEVTANAGNLPAQPSAFNDKIFWAN